MRTLDLYLLRRLALCLGLAIAALLLVSVVIDLTENIDTFIDFDAHPQQIVLYYIYRLPYWAILTLPISALLGSLFALTSLARHNEIAAMKALGIGLSRILAPVFISALGISILAFLFTDLVVSRATLRHNEIDQAIRSQKHSDGSRRQVLLQDAGEQLVFARNYDARQERADEISWERLKEGRPQERIVAHRMFWRGGRWVAHQGRHYAFTATGQTDTPFDSLAINTLELTPLDFARQQKAPEEMSYSELSAFIKRATRRGEDVTRHRVDLHLKISFPITCFIIIALGSTLGANARRTGLANSFGLGVFVCFAYYSCLKAGQALGWNEVLTPWLGAWIANLFFAALAVILLWRAHK